MIGPAHRIDYELRREPDAPRSGFAAVGNREPGFFIPIVRKFMQESEQVNGGAAFVFTSSNPKEGVSVVIAAVARELAAVSGEKVIVAESRAIGNLSPSPGPKSWSPVLHEGGGVYRLRPAESSRVASRIDRFDLLRHLKQLFLFVLIDCPALSASAEALEFGAKSQGIVLVAAAGRVRRTRLLQAQTLIKVSGVPLLGCALNRRTYPIPEFLYKRL